MSQQINLLLPELRPRFDWLALPVVGGAALAGLLLLVAMAVMTAMTTDGLKAREANVRNQLAALQQQVQSLGRTLGARQADTALERQIASARLAVSQRQEVLNVIAQGDVAGSNAYSGLLQGFSRQIVDGVWLVGFGFAQKDVEIRGRLTDPALLPMYINRLNAEPAFAGRRFATLDMKGVEPAAARADAAPAPATAVTTARFTEFVLRTEPEKGR
ncbi:MAG: hypothetical protein KA538_05395 [Azonexus sp.]|jgi:hypothetical protein|nr:hypothetical protein [Azonexus sp.]